jgi:hypothetical protein
LDDDSWGGSRIGFEKRGRKEVKEGKERVERGTWGKEGNEWEKGGERRKREMQRQCIKILSRACTGFKRKEKMDYLSMMVGLGLSWV